MRQLVIKVLNIIDARCNHEEYNSVYSDCGLQGFDSDFIVNLGPKPLTLMTDAAFSVLLYSYKTTCLKCRRQKCEQSLP